MISVVIPVYNSEETLVELINRLVSSLRLTSDSFEIILVEDCGKDNSWSKILQIAKEYPVVKGVKLSRNFGQHYAITAGLDLVKGDWIVVMDCDLQDKPEEIKNLLNKALEGFDVVLARRRNRQDSIIKKIGSKSFYKVLSYLTGVRQNSEVANFGIYSKKVISEVTKMREPIRFFPAMIKWVGFKTEFIDVEHDKRLVGKSSYNFKRLFGLAFDIALSYSDKPLKLAMRFGLMTSIFSLLLIIIYAIKWLNGDIVVLGYFSIIMSVSFFSGVIISSIGIVGLYLGKVFEAVKSRPIYVIEEKINV